MQGGQEQETLLLTGSTPITISGVSNMFTEILHRPIAFRTVPVDEYIQYHQQRGATPPYPTGEEDFLKKWATTFKALENGEAAVVDPLLQQVLGRELIPMKDTLTKLFKSEQTSK
jgi:hypothetical protein